MDKIHMYSNGICLESWVLKVNISVGNVTLLQTVINEFKVRISAELLKFS